MKILILAPPRTGSTYLTKILSRALKLKAFNEPFHYIKSSSYTQEYSINQLKNSDNIVFKVLNFQRPINTLLDPYTFYKSILVYFTHTLFLTRENFNEHFESYINLEYKRELEIKGGNGEYHNKYSYSNIPEEFKSKIYAEQYEEFKSGTDKFNEFIKSCGKDPLVYEKLFSDSIQNNFEYLKSFLPEFPEEFKIMLSNRHRYRILDDNSREFI